MSPRINIPAKLTLAAAPLVLAVGGLLTTTISSTLADANAQSRAADVTKVWQPTLDILEDINVEEHIFDGSMQGDVTAARAKTDADRLSLQKVIDSIGAPAQIHAARLAFTTELLQTRVFADSGDPAQAELAAHGFDSSWELLVEVASLLPPETGDRKLGRDLQAVSSFSEMSLHFELLRHSLLDAEGRDFEAAAARQRIDAVYKNLNGFEAAASEAILTQWNASGAEDKIEASLAQALTLVDAAEVTQTEAMAAVDHEAFDQTYATLAGLQRTFVTESIKVAETRAADTKRSVIMKVAIPSAAALLALVLAYAIARSIVRRIRLVTDRAKLVSEVELPKLVSALSDPSGRAPLPEMTPIEGAGNDEVGNLANSFSAVQSTLVTVAAEQMQVLRRGVSEIFVTLARRNRSLVDSQLSLLDRLEAEVEDPSTLADYYKIDHLATRMRRNTESLLVLANSDSRRRSSSALAIDDVVRASISEVEDYRRIEVLPMEQLAIKGPVVADMSHLLAELLDNAANFSPPTSQVKVAGHFTNDGYLLTITDSGVGMAPDRLVQLNYLLDNPPIIGLSVEPTLGLSVVSLLARKHGIRVQLIALSPGTAVNVVVPAALYDRRASYDDDAGYVAESARQANLGVEDMWPQSDVDYGNAPNGAPSPYDAPPSASSFGGASGAGGYSNGSYVDAGGDLNGHASEYGSSGIGHSFSPNSLDLPPSGSPVSTDAPMYADSQAPAVLPQRERNGQQSGMNATPTMTPPPPPPPPVSAPTEDPMPTPAAAPMPAPSQAAAPGSFSPTALPTSLPPAWADEPAEPAVADEPVELKTNAAGLPIRIPGRAKPKTGDDDRVSGATQPTKVRSSLAAYTRGAAAAKGTHGFSKSGIDHFGPTDSSKGSK